MHIQAHYTSVEQRKSRARQLEAQLPEHRPGELLVRLQPGVGFSEEVLDQLGGEVLHLQLESGGKSHRHPSLGAPHHRLIEV
jgi:hypothetical protein